MEAVAPPPATPQGALGLPPDSPLSGGEPCDFLGDLKIPVKTQEFCPTMTENRAPPAPPDAPPRTGRREGSMGEVCSPRPFHVVWNEKTMQMDSLALVWNSPFLVAIWST